MHVYRLPDRHRYIDVGTRDYTAYCSVNDAFKFRERFGDKKIIHYINKLARDGGELIVSRRPSST